MKINIVIPTFEPSYKEEKKSQKLKEFYLQNFQSWIDLAKENKNYLISLIFSDFKSSDDFLNYILKPTVEKNKSVIAILGEQKLSSTDALNIGLSFDKKADIYIYAASDTKIHKGWLQKLNLELSENQYSTIFFTTSLIGSSKTVDQVQECYIDKPAKILAIEEQPIPNVVIIRSSLLIGRTPSSLALFKFKFSLQATTSIPKAFPTFATCEPIFPNPIKPKTLPFNSSPMVVCQ